MSQPCQNNAECTNDNAGGYTCACTDGYSGVNCELGKTLRYGLDFSRLELNFLKLKLNPKASPCRLNEPCQNDGVCTDISQEDYSCECPYEFTGKNCETRNEERKKIIFID